MKGGREDEESARCFMDRNYYLNKCTVHKVNAAVGELKQDDEYILYNPYNYYWIVINSVGCEIIEAISKCVTYDKIKEYFEEKYKSDQKFSFCEDIEPFLEYLSKHRFVSDVPLEVPRWMLMKPDSLDVSKYKFNDIYISIEDECNLNCIYCFNKARRYERMRKTNGQKLNISKTCSLLKEFKELGGNTVVFTGGEPMLREDFCELLREVGKIGLNVQVITNGTMLNRVCIDKIVNFIDVLNISIDSIDDKELSILWGRKSNELLGGLFCGLEKLKDMMNKNVTSVRINIMPVVTKINYSSLITLVRRINEFFEGKVSWKFTMYGEIGISKIDNQLRINEKDFYDLLYEVAKLIYPNGNEILWQSYAINLGNSKRLLPFPRTSSCAPSFLVTETGAVYPCQGLECEENYLGNIWECGLKELFFKEEFIKIREKLLMDENNECFECDLKYVCTERCSICKLEKHDKTNCKDIVIKRMYYKVKGF